MVLPNVNAPRIGIIISTVRSSRVGPKVAEWIAQGAPRGIDVDIIDLAQVNLPFFTDAVMPAMDSYDQDTTKAWGKQVAGYDGFIIALGEYNGGYPAPLKNAIDTVYKEWNGKPVGVVSYGSHGGGRARTALKPVLQTVRAVEIDGPTLRFNEQIALDGQIIAAPQDDLGKMYTELVESLPDKPF